MDWTLAMAQEAGVRGKAGQLTLHSYLEELHTLASCAPAPSVSAPRLKSCIQCVESQLLVVITSVCMLVCPLRNVCACVCMHTHVCICSLFLLGQAVTSGSQPYLLQPQCLSLGEREEMLLDSPLHLGCRARASLTIRSVCLLTVFV